VIWLLSDTHFWHENIGKYCSRPERWQEKIITNWRQLVLEKDHVIHLGDVAFKVGKDLVKRLMDSLPGVKHLVRGNHDKGVQWMSDVGFDVWEPGTTHTIESNEFHVLGRISTRDQGDLSCMSSIPSKESIVLSHRPIPNVRWPYFYGHIHNNPMPFDDDRVSYPMPSILGRNICVEVINYQPVPLRALLGDIVWTDENFSKKPRSDEQEEAWRKEDEVRTMRERDES